MKFSIEFGLASCTISKQLRDQKLKFDERAIKTYENHSKQANLLWIAGLLTDRDLDRVRKRIMGNIKRAIV